MFSSIQSLNKEPCFIHPFDLDKFLLGDAMTHKLLDHDTQKIIYRSAVRPKKSSTPNHRLAPHGGEVSASSDPSEENFLLITTWSPNAKYKSISNTLHLLSAPVSIPHVGADLASLVVESKSNCKFCLSAIFFLIVDSCSHPSRALTRSLASLIPSTWTNFC